MRRVQLAPALAVPPARAPILRYGVALLSTVLALIPTLFLSDMAESRLVVFAVAVSDKWLGLAAALTYAAGYSAALGLQLVAYYTGPVAGKAAQQ